MTLMIAVTRRSLDESLNKVGFEPAVPMKKAQEFSADGRLFRGSLLCQLGFLIPYETKMIWNLPSAVDFLLELVLPIRSRKFDSR